MKIKLSIILLLSMAYINAMEENDSNIKSMLVEPASLKFQAAWRAVQSNKPLEKVGEPSIVELGNKIRKIQQCNTCSESEKKFFINILNNSNLNSKIIKEYFPNLIAKYMPTKEPEGKVDLLNAMLKSAVTKNNVPLVKLLISLGVDINTKLGRNSTPLIVAAIKGYNDLARELIKAGANVNVKDNAGTTPLMFAAEKGNKYIAQMLLNAGANIDAQNRSGYTALMQTISRNKEQMVKMLLEANANVNIYNSRYQTALNIAQRRPAPNEYIIEMLKKAGAQ